MTFAHNNLRVSIWSLVQSKLTGYILSPKFLPPRGLVFSENKKFAALAERKDAKDQIGIYYAGNDWKMVNQFDVDTYDLQDIKFINGDSSVIVWDTNLESRILIYSVATGNLVTKFEPEVIGLGIKKLSISPNDQIIAAGLFD